MTQREFLTKVIETTECEEIKAYAETAIEKLNTKNSNRVKKPTKLQIENQEIKAKIVEFVTENGISTSSEIAEALGLSTNRVSTLCSRLAADNELIKGEVKITGKGKRMAYSVA